MTTIVGNGTVGKALGKNIGTKPLRPSDEPIEDKVVIICVPTETINGEQDLSQVKQALSRIKKADLIILRSTVLPGTTDKLQKETDTPIVFVPEFGFEKTMVEDLANPEFYLIGRTKKRSKIEVIDILPEANNYTFMTARQAEFAKYFTNIWGFTNIILANEFKKWAGDDYERAIQGAMLKDNMPKWGWEIQGKVGGKCLPKDLKAGISQYPSKLFKMLEDLNEQIR